MVVALRSSSSSVSTDIQYEVHRPSFSDLFLSQLPTPRLFFGPAHGQDPANLKTASLCSSLSLGTPSPCGSQVPSFASNLASPNRSSKQVTYRLRAFDQNSFVNRRALHPSIPSGWLDCHCTNPKRRCGLNREGELKLGKRMGSIEELIDRTRVDHLTSFYSSLRFVSPLPDNRPIGTHPSRSFAYRLLKFPPIPLPCKSPGAGGR